MTTEPTTPDTKPAPQPTKVGLIAKIKSRPGWLAVFIISLIVFTISSAAMVQRVRSYNQSTERPARFAFQPISETSFEYAGLPVSFVQIPSETGLGSVRVTYADQELLLPIRVDGIDEVPDLRRYENWMQVLRFFETTGMSVTDAQAKLDAGELTDRLAIAIRIPPAGANEQTWGRVGKREWRYELHEFLPPTDPEGPALRTERFVPPETDRSYNRRVARASRNNEPIPERRDDELKQGTWQHDAAQLTMPDNRGFAPVFGADAFTAFGWTFPAAGVAAFPLAISLAFLVAPRREEVDARAALS